MLQFMGSQRVGHDFPFTLVFLKALLLHSSIDRIQFVS